MKLRDRFSRWGGRILGTTSSEKEFFQGPFRSNLKQMSSEANVSFNKLLMIAIRSLYAVRGKMKNHVCRNVRQRFSQGFRCEGRDLNGGGSGGYESPSAGTNQAQHANLALQQPGNQRGTD